jgi:nucleoside 2-deoxyribosyltransferase
MKVYVAGPMTGYEEFNRPAFDEMAEFLRSKGHAVVNPHELTDSVFNGNRALPHATYMKADLGALLQCDAIVLLDGWDESKGALCEAHVALRTGLTFLAVDAYGNVVERKLEVEDE